MIYLLGTGLNCIDDLSNKAINILKQADLIVGFKHSLTIPRQLQCRGEIEEMDIYSSLKDEKIEELIETMKKKENAVVCVGGSPIIFSYTRKIAEKLQPDLFQYIHSSSSIEYLSEKHGVELNDLSLVSGHNSNDLLKSHAVCLQLIKMGRKIGYFVKNEDDLMSLLVLLFRQSDSFGLTIYAGYELGTDEEKIFVIDDLNTFDYTHGRWILLIVPNRQRTENIQFPKNNQLCTSGIPVSREWSRSLITHSLDIQPSEMIWDLGAGSGASSIWLASLTGCFGKVYAVEKDEVRYDLLVKNTSLHPNIIPCLGDFHHIVNQLPSPDCVHIGGGFSTERLQSLFKLLPTGTRFACALATVDSFVALKQVKDISYDCEMYTRSTSRNLGGKTAFVGEHVFYLFKGVKK